jgi:hypothetical protein
MIQLSRYGLDGKEKIAQIQSFRKGSREVNPAGPFACEIQFQWNPLFIDSYLFVSIITRQCILRLRMENSENSNEFMVWQAGI